MAKNADVMRDVTKGVKMHKVVDPILSTTNDKTPEKDLFPTTFSLEKQMDAVLEAIKKMEKSNGLLHEDEYEALETVDELPEDGGLGDDAEDITVASSVDPDVNPDATIVTTISTSEPEPVAPVAGQQVSINSDETINVGVVDGKLSIQSKGVNIAVSSDAPAAPAPVVDTNVVADTSVDAVEDDVSDDDVADVNFDADEPVEDEVMDAELDPEDSADEMADVELDDEDEYVDEAEYQEACNRVKKKKLAKKKVAGKKQPAKKAPVQKAKTNKEKLQKEMMNLGSAIDKLISEHYKPTKFTLVNEALDNITLKFDRLIQEAIKPAKKNSLFENMSRKAAHFDKLLESFLNEDEDVQAEVDEELLNNEEFDMNDSVDNMDDAIDKADDLLGDESDMPEGAPAVLHVTLPAGVSSDDVVVKVTESVDEAPTIQIVLPEDSNVDEIGVTVDAPEDVPVEGLPNKDVDVEADVNEDTTIADVDVEAMDAEDVDTEDLPEDVEDAEDVEVPEDEEELDEEDEEKLEEAVRILNKKLLPIAENAPYSPIQANKNLLEGARKADTTFNINVIKQAHTYYINEGKNISDYRYPIADVIDHVAYAIPGAIVKLAEYFSNPVMVEKVGPAVTKIARTRLAAYLEAMGKELPWVKKESNLILTENGALLSVVHKRQQYTPDVFLKTLEAEFNKGKK